NRLAIRRGLPQVIRTDNGKESRTEIERWRREYNEERPKKAIGGMTPSAYAQQLANAAIINPGL
ncbi:integrase core domain-containing protein, partial [Xanthomonas phaseoli pv. manihotis]|uniref:integrase core domain-containing protein n=1 Tax=Xanthomonas phaseoli TaxID=1985254 RepID=UPI001ADA64AA